MNQNPIFCAGQTTEHTRDAVVNAPPRLPSDLFIAHRTETALFMPEITKHTVASKRLPHMSPFTFFEVDFPCGIVRVSGASDLNMSSDGCAAGALQS
jgi:hypothetical protein